MLSQLSYSPIFVCLVLFVTKFLLGLLPGFVPGLLPSLPLGGLGRSVSDLPSPIQIVSGELDSVKR